jgi:uncharacterized membrane protein
MREVVTDSFKRSFAKALSFRIFVIITDALIIYAVTRRFDTTVTFLTISTIIRTVLYIIHERSWDAVSWGRGYRSMKNK